MTKPKDDLQELNTRDLFALGALMALIVSGAQYSRVAYQAYLIANDMIEERQK